MVIGKSGNQIIASNPTMDYLHRPEKYKSVCLYDWIRRATKAKMSKKQAKAGEREGKILIDEILAQSG